MGEEGWSACNEHHRSKQGEGTAREKRRRLWDGCLSTAAYEGARRLPAGKDEVLKDHGNKG